MKLQGWICVTCERPFTRRWNADRHIAKQHPGQLSQPVSVIEYLAGRQSGIYQPPSQTQSTSPPLSARKSATNMQDILRIFEFTEKVKQEGDSLAHVMTEEYAREIGRQSAVISVSKAKQQSQATFISKMYPMMWQSPSHSNNLFPTGNIGDIFGFRCHICSKCLMMKHLDVSYPIEQFGVIVEERHLCDPGLIVRTQNLDENDKEKILKIMREYQPQYLKNVVNPWSGGVAYIAGIELSSSLSTTPLPNDQIKIPHPKDPRRSVTFHYSNEQIVELQANMGVGNPDHWSVRVLRKGRTNLADNELQEFLNLVKNATFGIFKLYTPKIATTNTRNVMYQEHKNKTALPAAFLGTLSAMNRI